MARCGDSRHRLLPKQFAAMGIVTAPGPAPDARDSRDGVLFVYYGADALVITATAGGGDQPGAALEANPRLRSVWE
jgi:hypothetical protein